MKLFSVRRLAIRYAWRNRRRIINYASATGAGAVAWAQRLLGMQSAVVRVSDLSLSIHGHGARGWCTLSPYLVLGLRPALNSNQPAAAGAAAPSAAGALQQPQRTRHATKANYCEDMTVHFPGSLNFTVSGSPAATVLGIELMARRDFLLPPRRVAYGELPLLALFADARTATSRGGAGAGSQAQAGLGPIAAFDSWIDLHAAPEAADADAGHARSAGLRFASVHVRCSVAPTAETAPAAAGITAGSAAASTVSSSGYGSASAPISASASVSAAAPSSAAAGGAGLPPSRQPAASAAAAAGEQSATASVPVITRSQAAAAGGAGGPAASAASVIATEADAAGYPMSRDQDAPPSLAPIVASGTASETAPGGFGGVGGMMSSLLRLGGMGTVAAGGTSVGANTSMRTNTSASATGSSSSGSGSMARGAAGGASTQPGQSQPGRRRPGQPPPMARLDQAGAAASQDQAAAGGAGSSSIGGASQTETAAGNLKQQHEGHGTYTQHTQGAGVGSMRTGQPGPPAAGRAAAAAPAHSSTVTERQGTEVGGDVDVSQIPFARVVDLSNPSGLPAHRHDGGAASGPAVSSAAGSEPRTGSQRRVF